MKVLIDIPKAWGKCKISFLKDCIANGIVLDGLTNGEVIRKIFPKVEYIGENTHAIYLSYWEDEIIALELDWWNRKWGE